MLNGLLHIGMFTEVYEYTVSDVSVRLCKRAHGSVLTFFLSNRLSE